MLLPLNCAMLATVLHLPDTTYSVMLSDTQESAPMHAYSTFCGAATKILLLFLGTLGPACRLIKVRQLAGKRGTTAAHGLAAWLLS
jgi:hypothetical protein